MSFPNTYLIFPQFYIKLIDCICLKIIFAKEKFYLNLPQFN